MQKLCRCVAQNSFQKFVSIKVVGLKWMGFFRIDEQTGLSASWLWSRERFGELATIVVTAIVTMQAMTQGIERNNFHNSCQSLFSFTSDKYLLQVDYWQDLFPFVVTKTFSSSSSTGKLLLPISFNASTVFPIPKTTTKTTDTKTTWFMDYLVNLVTLCSVSGWEHDVHWNYFCH